MQSQYSYFHIVFFGGTTATVPSFGHMRVLPDWLQQITNAFYVTILCDVFCVSIIVPNDAQYSSVVELGDGRLRDVRISDILVSLALSLFVLYNSSRSWARWRLFLISRD